MRWFWIDRFTQFVSGHKAVSLKNVSLAEEHLHGYLPGYPFHPPSLVLEGLAQTGGLLLAELTEFKQRLVLAKVSRLTTHFVPRPGDTLRYVAELDSVGPEGARIAATSHVGERLQAEAELFIAVLPSGTEAVGESLYEPREFAQLLRILRIYEVGVDQEGNPLQMPSDLVVEPESTMSD